MHLTTAETTRFKSKTRREGVCLVWTGPLDKDGYGTFYLRQRGRRAHRVAWYAVNGPIPEGAVINHTCRNRACVNPQHLTLLTAEQNTLRDSGSMPYLNSQKTHCAKGHLFDRTYVRTATGRSYRECSICKREYQREMRKRWRAQDATAC